MKLLAKRFLRKLGLDIVKADREIPLNLTEYNEVDPICFSYLAKNKTFLAQIPLDKCMFMGVLAFKAGKNSKSPFVITLNEYLNGDSTSYANSYLKKYYSEFQPANAAELLGLSEPSELLKKHFPKPTATYWIHIPDDIDGTRLNRTLHNENKKYGLDKGLEAGHPWFGPVLEEKGKLEFKRLVDITNKIKKYGFKYSKEGIDNIRGVFFIKDDEWRFVVYAGHHRIAALSALDHKEVIIQTTHESPGGVVTYESVKSWPIVKQNVLSQTQAKAMFTKYFN